LLWGAGGVCGRVEEDGRKREGRVERRGRGRECEKDRRELGCRPSIFVPPPAGVVDVRETPSQTPSPGRGGHTRD